MAGEADVINNFVAANKLAVKLGLNLTAEDGFFQIKKDGDVLYSKAGISSIRAFLDGYDYGRGD